MQQHLLFDDAPNDFGLIGCSPRIQRVLRTIRKLHNDSSTVLITGESGVGKELAARALHSVSSLANKKFLAVDAASLVGSLMESELFGHTRGAFTGAVRDKPGLVRAAEGGTLFLDEIGELSPDLQAKLLRLLQEKEIRPIGSTHPVRVNVRILAATNRDLTEEVRAGRFRKDLYYRLYVICVHLPPLRDRRHDIPLLVKHFLEKYSAGHVVISEHAVERFKVYDWPGNVRELENVIQSIVALKSDPLIHLHDLPSALVEPEERTVSIEQGADVIPLDDVERQHILHAIEHTQGDVATAAQLLGIGKTTLYRKLKQYRTDDPEATQELLFAKQPAAKVCSSEKGGPAFDSRSSNRLVSNAD